MVDSLLRLSLKQNLTKVSQSVSITSQVPLVVTELSLKSNIKLADEKHHTEIKSRPISAKVIEVAMKKQQQLVTTVDLAN